MKNKKVLVTGADGFIGSHLCEHLLEQGASVRALSLYNSFNYWGWLEDVQRLKEIDVVCGDIRDPAFCRLISRDIDIVFNLAALIAIPFSYVAPASYVETNIHGALNICQAARDNGVGLVVQISTSEVYGTARYVPIDENHPLTPQSPYSASKIGADALAMSFHHAFSLPVIVARPFNTYGPRQSARAIIPTVITQIAAGQRVINLGDLSPTRDFTFVPDTCRGLALLASCPEAVGQTVNIGSNFEISMRDVVMKIKNLMGRDVEIQTEEQRLRPADSEVNRLWCDNAKLRGLTGFSPQYSLDDGLRKTIDWFTQPGILQKYKPGMYNI